jgi:hypothetical protein
MVAMHASCCSVESAFNFNASMDFEMSAMEPLTFSVVRVMVRVRVRVRVRVSNRAARLQCGVA